MSETQKLREEIAELRIEIWKRDFVIRSLKDDVAFHRKKADKYLEKLNGMK